MRFKPEAVVSSPVLTLADVAEIQPVSRAKALGGLELFPAPGPGQRVCHKSSTLRAYVRQAVSDGENIEWSGAENVCVRHAGTLVTAAKIRSVVNARLRTALSRLGAERVAFDIRNEPGPVNLPHGKVTYEVVFSDPEIINSRKVTVIIRVDGRVAENVSIAGRVQAFLPVAAAARELKRGEVLTKSDVSWPVKNIAGLRQPCLDPETVVGRCVVRPVKAGGVLHRRDLDRPVLVERRQLVTMILEKGNLRIQARGMATTDGKKGEVILVKNMRSNREIPCKVVGRKTVRVDF